MNPYQVRIQFGSGIPDELQGKVMLDLERSLRQAGLDAWVEKDPMGDDSKLRVKMTLEERNKL